MEAARDEEEKHQDSSDDEDEDETMGNVANVEENSTATTNNKKRKETDDDASAVDDTPVPLTRIQRKRRRKRQAQKRRKAEKKQEEEELIEARKEKERSDWKAQLLKDLKEREEREIEEMCLALRNNTHTEIDLHFSDDQAKAVGQALIGNTMLEFMELHITAPLTFCSPVPKKPSLTLPSVQALCDGILQSQVKELWVSSKITDASIRQCVFRTIETSQTITKLAFDFMKPLDTDSITCLGQALKNNAGIKELEITVERYLSDVMANALSLALQQSHISKLKIDCHSNHHYSSDIPADQAAVAFVTLFEAIQQKMQSLKALVIHNFEGGLPLITLLADGLQSSTTLKVLDLHDGKELGSAEAIRVLFQGLNQNSSLTTLGLDDSSINDDSVILFAANLNQDLQLEKLDFGGEGHGSCKIGSSGALALVRAVANMPAMQVLDLSDNHDIGYEGLRLIGEELPNLCLRELNLTFFPEDPFDDDDDDFENDEANELRESARQALLQGMRENHYLWHLGIKDTTFRWYNFFREMNFRLDMNRWGIHMAYEDHGLSPTIWCHIFGRAREPKASLENYITFIFHVLGEQPTLVRGS